MTNVNTSGNRMLSLSDKVLVHDTFASLATHGTTEVSRRIVTILPECGPIPAEEAIQIVYGGLMSQITPEETLLYGEGGTDWLNVGPLDETTMGRYYAPGTVVSLTSHRPDFPAFVVPTTEYDDYRANTGHWIDPATAEAYYQSMIATPSS